MRRDARIVLVIGDLGYRMWDQIAAEFPSRLVNVGAAEQLMMGAAVGMTHDGLIPVVYSITPFLLYRPAEWIRNLVNHERAPVRLLGAGRGSADHTQEDYHEDGFTHYAGDDKAFLSIMPNVKGFWPETVDELDTVTQEWLYHPGPSYLNLRR